MKADQIEPQNPPNDLPNYWGRTPEEEYYSQQGIKSTKSYFKTLSNQTLFTRSWQPLIPPRGIICMVHGYGNDISWTFQGTPIYLAQNGFSCFALDLPGHGNSDGLKAFVPNVDLVVDDCISYFNTLMDLPEFQSLPFFLFGESMGGAICLLISLKLNSNNDDQGRSQDFKVNGAGTTINNDSDQGRSQDLNDKGVKGFKGAILIAPMCKISDKVRPRWPIPEVLTMVGRFMPTLPIVPTPDLLNKSIKVEEKKVVAVANPRRYNGKPRLGTVMELLRVTDYLSEKLKEVVISFIVLHGSADVVTDPNVSRALYEEAKSADKTIKIYEGMLHSLLFGETDENVALVRSDILAWLSDRCKAEGQSTEGSGELRRWEE